MSSFFFIIIINRHQILGLINFCFKTERSNEIFDSLKNEYEDHIPIYLNRIQYLASNSKTSNDQEKKCKNDDEIISLSRLALEKINQNDLLRYFGEKHHDPANDEHKK